MIKAVIFDMFETLVTLFTGKTYFSEDIAEDLGISLDDFRREWHVTEKDRSTGKYTIGEGLAIALKQLGVYSEDKVKLAAEHRKQALTDTFTAIPEETVNLLRDLRKAGKKTGLITNTFSDERDFIRESELYPLFDAALISYEQGICKPAPELFRRMTELLGVEPGECLYVGDGGSRELFAAREAGMKAVQCTWFHDLAFEPHIPCPILDEFEQAGHPSDILRIAERD
jgi:putative hydrolase of the HAD superfamily